MVVVRDPAGNRIKLPDCWANCSTAIFQRIVKEWEPDKELKDRSRVKLFSIMLNRDISLITDSHDEELEAALWECTRFVYEESSDFTRLRAPKGINIEGKHLTLPTDLGRMSIGQNIHVRDELATGALLISDGNYHAARVSLVTAIYLQPLFDGSKFDFNRAKELEQVILRMPIFLIYPIGFFFLNRLKNYGNGWRPTLNRMTLRIATSVRLLLSSRRAQNLMTILGPLL